jgi:hypothetical protein|tara:strand:+ start:55 stop:225 length:171 start_codon:yes stop_codon:yes gene_type:complete
MDRGTFDDNDACATTGTPFVVRSVPVSQAAVIGTEVGDVGAEHHSAGRHAISDLEW